MLPKAPLAALAAALVLASLSAAPAAADYPEWPSVADVGVIEVVTSDPDGGPRTTKVWFVLLDGEPYLRTASSRWLDNLRRDPELSLVIEGVEYEARAEEVEGEEIVARVEAAMREKYGWQDRMVGLFSRQPPDVLRLSPREPGS